ncbi:fimbria/pilus outer membrane usher protein [Proteus vulgaris]|uniref:Fimbria/pilus outer membrane usher protein n=1 Tax=Proteus vulgaris TaxID=585 RepID=A0A6G6SLI0_PROVU|nr:fimbria/pilus outer membrane usher protein [Proteus vulgaris]QIF94540.1 fimbria/pilus outer membrane usher protein [Proteus vulgaris]WIF70706.1 fimbria/pilus outer membrane usher protein [Proteus vulgaris]CRL60377.1 Outer membrane usher protein FimD precursor [Proteus vulgaris]SUC01558.1 fimbrial usher protein [Proteus vulgaris]
MKLTEKRVAKLNKKLRLIFLISSFTFVIHTMPLAIADEYEFDPALLLGNKNNINMNQLHDSNYISPGDYDVDIYINNRFVERKTIKFKLNDNDKVLPCFTLKQIDEMGILLSDIMSNENTQCLSLNQINKNIVDTFDAANFRITIAVPQILLKRTPQGYVNEADLDAGNTMLFTNYTGNYYKNKSRGQTSDYGFASVNLGVNLGTWQFRQQASYSYNSSKAGSDSDFNWIRTYLQKPILSLKSTLVVGDIYTAGTQFSSLAFKGLQLMSDERMLPDSQKGYAPVIRGIATTTARVVVKQNGTEIYQTTVSPGQFEINDLYPTSYEGDLLVEIHEGNGKISSFTVPFSALPESVRAGRFKYNFTAGEVNNFGSENSYFSDLALQYGLNNTVTLNTGLRVGHQYQAIFAGSVIATKLGAFGFNSALSNAEINGKNYQGGRLGMSYSRTFSPTNTVITLAGYKYSTENFREYNDVLGLRKSANDGMIWNSNSYNQESQFTLSVNQALDKWGQLYISGSISNYYGNKGHDAQYQIGYSNTYKDIAYNIAYSRQKTGQMIANNTFTSTKTDSISEDMIMVSVSMPLGMSDYSPMLSLSSSHASDDSSYQANLSGLLGEDKTLSYSVNTDYDTQNRAIGSGLHVIKQLPFTTLSGSISNGKHYTQGSIGVQGALVAHSGGVTLGPRISESFALIEAKGANGASVSNGMGSKIDYFGYAIVPSLVPYQYNNVSLDGKNIQNNNIELLENTKQIAPYSGASTKIVFKTRVGYPVLIGVKPETQLALGDNVYDKEGHIVGMVGQSNQVYVRVENREDTLIVGKEANSCKLTYSIPEEKEADKLILLSGQCL